MRQLILVLTTAVVVAETSSAAATFVGLSFLPGGGSRSSAEAVSADGRVVVGHSGSTDSASDGGYDAQAFRWSPDTGLVGLGDLAGGEHASWATDVSADGSVVVGMGTAPAGFEAFRWTQPTGLTGLGDLPGGLYRSSAQSVSADGSVIVGYSGSEASLNSGYEEAFRWTTETGLVGLGDLPGSTFASWGLGISGDGTVVVGASFSILTEQPGGRAEAFRWTADEGMIGLGELPGGELYSSAMGISFDGSVIVGQSSPGPFPTYEAVIWDTDGSITALGDFSGGRHISLARASSGDGSVAVGCGNRGELTAYDCDTALIWDSTHGLRSFQEVLTEEFGIDLEGWRLLEAKDISADGRVVVGVGVDPDGNRQGWVAVIPEPSTALLLGIGLVVLAMRSGHPRRCGTLASVPGPRLVV